MPALKGVWCASYRIAWGSALTKHPFLNLINILQAVTFLAKNPSISVFHFGVKMKKGLCPDRCKYNIKPQPMFARGQTPRGHKWDLKTLQAVLLITEQIWKLNHLLWERQMEGKKELKVPLVLGWLPPSCKNYSEKIWGKFIGKILGLYLDPEEGAVWQKTILFVHPSQRSSLASNGQLIYNCIVQGRWNIKWKWELSELCFPDF